MMFVYGFFYVVGFGDGLVLVVEMGVFICFFWLVFVNFGNLW